MRNQEAREGLARIMATTDDPSVIERALMVIERRGLADEPGPDDELRVHLIKNDYVSACGVLKVEQGRVDPQLGATLEVEKTTCVKCLRAAYAQVAKAFNAEVVHARGAFTREDRLGGTSACGEMVVPGRLLCDDARAATCIFCLGAEIDALREQREDRRIQVPPKGSLREDLTRIFGLLEGSAGGYTLVREDREIVVRVIRAALQ